MHELALSMQVRRIAERAADGRRVDTVNLRIGRLRQVMPQAMRRCWAMVTAGTVLEGSALAIESVPVTVRCCRCGTMSRINDEFSLACDSCGTAEVDIVEGEEFLLTSLDLATAADSQPLPEAVHG